MKKKIISLITVFTFLLSMFCQVSAVDSQLSIDFPTLMLADAEQSYEFAIPFAGKGIDSISLVRNGADIQIVDSTWTSGQCKLTVKLNGSKSGRFTLNLNNNDKGVIFSKQFIVLIKDKTTTQVDETYTVAHNKGVNIRSLPTTSSSIRQALPKGAEIHVSLTQDGWGYLPDYNGFVSLKYCTKNSTTSSSHLTSGYNPSKALDFAANHAFTNSEWLCAEFVSRSLKAGGLKIDIWAGVGDLYRALEKMDGVTKYTLKVDKSGKILPKNNSGKLSKGDVIILYCNSCKSIDGKPYIHAVMVGDLSSDGVKVYAHNNAYSNKVYYGFNKCGFCGSSNVIAYGFHFE